MGRSVSLSADGNCLAAGASGNADNGRGSGQVRVFQWSGTNWVQIGADINGEAAGDASGASVSISSDGSRVAIGAIGDDSKGELTGQVRVFQLTNNTWLQLGNDIYGESAGDYFSRSVSLSSDGNRLAVGADQYFQSGAGYVRVYQWNDSEWLQLGADINGEATGDRFGESVSLSADGNRLAIGAYTNDNNGESSGQVRVYQWNGSSWQQLGRDINGEVAGDYFGYSVALSAGGDRLASGAYGNSGGNVRVFDWNGTDWLQLGDSFHGREESGHFGVSVALSAGGNRLAVGDTWYEGGPLGLGQVRVYQWSGAAWTQLGHDINGIAEGDHVGNSVAFSSDGSRLAAGAHGLPVGDIYRPGRVSVYDFSMFNVFQMNPGLNDAWYYPLTSGQGFFITVFPDLGAVSLAWFTYDTELPPADAVANLGDPGHRWLTAVGPIDGNKAVMDIELTSGGIFDAASVIHRTDPPGSDGTITLTFDDCSSGTIEYDIPSINRQGVVPIQRVAADNITLCESFSQQ